jgi:hypothetical protein
VTVPADASTASFTVATTPVEAKTSALITAARGTASRSFTLAATPVAMGPAVPSVTFSSSTVVGGTPVTGTGTLDPAAPDGGTTVVLTSDNTNVVTVPTSVDRAQRHFAGELHGGTKPVTTAPAPRSLPRREAPTITATSEFTGNTAASHWRAAVPARVASPPRRR